MISQEEWDRLDERDQLLLKQMGIQVKPKAVPKPKEKNPVTQARLLSTRNTPPTEYFLKVISVCECCDSVVVKVGKMTLAQPRDRFLTFIEEEVPVEAVVKQKKLFPINCIHCEQRLGALDKEVLVQKIVHLTKQAVLRGWI